ncbi:MAG: hypothetical protein H0Z39_05805 [Peptococcaceae bacterium]|nr:hypothetical protein [Peptococcaceae bacterium]
MRTVYDILRSRGRDISIDELRRASSQEVYKLLIDSGTEKEAGKAIDDEMLLTYRHMARRAAKIIFVTTGKNSRLPATRVIAM